MYDDRDCPRHSNYKVFSSQDLAHTCQKLERRDVAPGFLSYPVTQLEAKFWRCWRWHKNHVPSGFSRASLEFSPWRGRYSLLHQGPSLHKNPPHALKPRVGFCHGHLRIRNTIYKARRLRSSPEEIPEEFPNGGCRWFPEEIKFDGELCTTLKLLQLHSFEHQITGVF